MDEDERRILWKKRNYYGLKWSEGFTSLQTVKALFNGYNNNLKIYVKFKKKCGS